MVLGRDAAEGVEVGGGDFVAAGGEGFPGIPRRGDEAAADAVAVGREQPFDAIERAFQR